MLSVSFVSVSERDKYALYEALKKAHEDLEDEGFYDTLPVVLNFYRNSRRNIELSFDARSETIRVAPIELFPLIDWSKVV